MITIKVPATTANLGPGFDTLGMALSLFLEVNMAFSSENSIECYGVDADELNKELEKNLIMQAAKMVLEKAGRSDQCLHIQINNEIPLGKGLGSSAAAIVAGMFGANELLGKPYPRDRVLAWAVEMEGHADNIVPAVMGGLTTALLSDHKVQCYKITPPVQLKMVLAVPDFELPTPQSRSVLPAQVTFGEAVQMMQKSCFLLASLSNGDFENIQGAMNDELIQPKRKMFIPAFDQVVNSALEAGARGVALSGAGPSIIAMTVDHEEEIGAAMKNAFLESSVPSKVYVLHPCTEGMTLLVS
ncbi:MAG: homoserine kinase [Bacillota bacterium]|nr:homoserine kinase [Bacillota bacterium]